MSTMILGGFMGYSVGSTILQWRENAASETCSKRQRTSFPPSVVDAALEVRVRRSPDGEVPLEEVVLQRLRVVLRRRLRQLLGLPHQALHGCNCFDDIASVSLYFRIIISGLTW